MDKKTVTNKEIVLPEGTAFRPNRQRMSVMSYVGDIDGCRVEIHIHAKQGAYPFPMLDYTEMTDEDMIQHFQQATRPYVTRKTAKARLRLYKALIKAQEPPREAEDAALRILKAEQSP